MKAEGCCIAGCVKKVHRRDYCQSHYRKLNKYGDANYIAPIPEKPLCSMLGCKNKTRAKELCSAHYNKTFPAAQKPCATGGCDKVTYLGRFCNSCLWIIRKMRRLAPGAKCQIEECMSNAITRGYCSSHYQRLIQTGNPLAVRKMINKGNICSVPDCTEGALKKGELSKTLRSNF